MSSSHKPRPGPNRVHQAASSEKRAITTPSSPRFDRLDALRATAILWMASFHFAFDLDHFGFTQQDFYRDPFWLNQRTCIVALFLFCAGVSQAVAFQSQQAWPRFWRRWLQVAACAVLVTLGSWFIFPQSVITFGTLHGIAVMLIITRLTARWRLWLWPLGLVAIALPSVVQSPFFNTRATNWVGLITVKPITEDYVPILPWLGVMWFGMAAGQWVLDHRRQWVEASLPAALQPLATLGRWSLTFYMLHQPILFGLLTLLQWARR